MPEFHRILVAADFSEHSLKAFNMACSLARAGQTDLIVLHVTDAAPVLEQAVAFGSTDAPIFQPAGGREKAICEHLREDYVPDRSLEVKYRTCEGQPAEEILRSALENGCDLIVMGTHGRGPLGRFLAGSVAEAVMRKAPCPVMTVRLPS
jgi:nucleotide-binding universal stress UspA family protein